VPTGPGARWFLLPSAGLAGSSGLEASRSLGVEGPKASSAVESNAPSGLSCSILSLPPSGGGGGAGGCGHAPADAGFLSPQAGVFGSTSERAVAGPALVNRGRTTRLARGDSDPSNRSAGSPRKRRALGRRLVGPVRHRWPFGVVAWMTETIEDAAPRPRSTEALVIRWQPFGACGWSAGVEGERCRFRISGLRWPFGVGGASGEGAGRRRACPSGCADRSLGFRAAEGSKARAGWSNRRRNDRASRR
jgi:hypothetical protein